MTMQLKVVDASKSSSRAWQVFYDIEYDWALALGDVTELSGATAISNPALADVWDAHRVFVSGADFNSVRDALSQAGIKAVVWDINRCAARDAMEAALRDNSFQRRAGPVQVLKKWNRPAPTSTEVIVIPARAALDQYAELCRQWTAEDKQDAALAHAMTLHLDDPKYDALIALDDAGPVGMAGLQSRGDAGRLQEVYVVPTHRGRGIGSMLLDRVIELAARAQLKSIFVMTAPGNHKARALYTRLGFDLLGDYVVYMPADATSV